MENRAPGQGERKIQVIVGMSRQGKTTLLRNQLKKSRKAIAFDPTGVVYPGLILNSRFELESWLDENWSNERFRIIYRPDVDEADRKAIAKEANYICYVAREVESVDLFIDECDLFSSVEEIPPELLALLITGGRKQVSIHAVVHRPCVNAPRQLITEATDFSIFKTGDRADCQRLAGRTNIPIEEMQKLQKWHYLYWTETNSENYLKKTVSHDYNT